MHRQKVIIGVLVVRKSLVSAILGTLICGYMWKPQDHC